jgi:uncharacterized protein (DUF362 family)
MKEIDRRQFLKTGIKAGVALGSLTVVPKLSAKEMLSGENLPDISVATGARYYNTTMRAIEQLGGIEKFIQKGDTVGILANSGYGKPGTYTRPDVFLAVAHLCFEAGASNVYCLKNESKKYWRRSPLSEKHQSLISRLQEDEYAKRKISIPNGKTLKEAKVSGGFLRYEKVISIPIVKDHGEIGMTCTLKNTMGISSMSTNMTFHTGPNVLSGIVKSIIKTTVYHDQEHLAQCIADLNLIRDFDLYVVDATQFITTNGPSGPGDLRKLNKVVAGTDRVAVDSYCCRYLDLDPQSQIMIRKARGNQLGEMELRKVTVKET